MGEPDFIQFIRLRNQLIVAVRDFSKEENLAPVQVKLLAKDMEELLKLTHKIVEVVDRPHKKICVTMLRYNVEKPETSYVQVRLFGGRKDEEKFNQIVYVIYKLDEFIYLLDVLKSVYDKVLLTNLFVMFCNKQLQVFTLYYHFFLLESEWVGTLEKTETCFSNWNQNWDFIMLY